MIQVAVADIVRANDAHDLELLVDSEVFLDVFGLADCYAIINLVKLGHFCIHDRFSLFLRALLDQYFSNKAVFERDSL